MTAIVLVGGGGTRLRPLTYAVPKPLVPVLNRPLVCHIIANLRRPGVDNVILATSAPGMGAGRGAGSALGVSLTYSYETEPLGSGLAVKQAAPRHVGAFFGCTGDGITDLDLTAMAARHRRRDRRP